MEFEVTDDRRMLADSLDRVLGDLCSFDRRTATAYAAPWSDPALWQALADLGLFYAFLPEDQGGIGGAGFDVTCVFEPLGRALCPEPVLAQLMGLRLLAAAGADTGPALNGAARLALAFGEPDAPWDLADITTRAENGRLTGRKSVIYGAPLASDILVAALENGKLALYRLTPEAAQITPYGMIDGGGAAELLLEDTPAELLLPDATHALDSALDWGRLALAAEAVGAMDAAFALLTETLKTRQQFGRPIGTFQALQHRAVDLRIEIEQARSITIRAAAAIGTDDGPRAVAQAKNLIGRAGKLVAEETIQMQGGIAMTWDYAASHYAKRLTMIDHQLGDAPFHASRLAHML